MKHSRCACACVHAAGWFCIFRAYWLYILQTKIHKYFFLFLVLNLYLFFRYYIYIYSFQAFTVYICVCSFLALSTVYIYYVYIYIYLHIYRHMFSETRKYVCVYIYIDTHVQSHIQTLQHIPQLLNSIECRSCQHVISAHIRSFSYHIIRS